MKTVFILGAGASAKAGVPLMADFLDSAWELMRYGTAWLSNYYDDFKRVQDIHTQLQGIHIKSYLDLNNIETLFGAIELGAIIRKLGDLKTDEITALNESIRALILKTIEIRTIYGLFGEGQTNAPEPYGTLLDQVYKRQDAAAKEGLKHDFSFLTFNYDVALDYAFKLKSMPFDYCIDHRKSDNYKLLKLHGSINWFEDTDGQIHTIYPNKFTFINQHISQKRANTISIDGSKRNSKIKNIQSIRAPLIVPPVWDKIKYQEKLNLIWQKAAEELGSANHVVIIGYSLPDTDQFFRYLFALGSQSDTLIQKVLIVNPELPEGGKYPAEERFKSMFGGSIQARIKPIRKKFEEAIPEIFIELPT
jgi:hypothetical protein